METRVSDEIGRRSQFGELLNRRMLLGDAVEVGTHRAWFAGDLMDCWRGQRLYCVDPWSQEIRDYDDPISRSGHPRWKDYRAARRRMKPHKARVTFLRMLSAEAVGQFHAESLDFVYIDANHRWDFVLGDLRMWWPTVKKCGILAGHDIEGEWEPHVRKALELFVADRPLVEGSWYIVKPCE